MERRVKERTLAKMTGKQNSYRVDLSISLLEIDMHNHRGYQFNDSEPYFFQSGPNYLVEISNMALINQISCSAHRTTNFTNPEFQFPQF